MRKVVSMYWQLVLFPVLYVPYMYLNTEVIVKWLGCGCPRLDATGHILPHSFSANDFTALFWGLVALFVIGISIWNMRWFRTWYGRLLYLLIITVACLGFWWEFVQWMMWL